MTVEELYLKLRTLVKSGKSDIPVVVSNFYSENLTEETEDLMAYVNYDGTKFVINVEI